MDSLPKPKLHTGLLAWFASNPVAANLLMMLIIIGGLVGYRVMDKEVFPRFNPQNSTVTAPDCSELVVGT